MSSTLSQHADARPQVNGMIAAAFITTIFGGVWLFIASDSLGGSVQPLLFVLVALLTLGLLIGCLRVTRAAWKQTRGGTPLFAGRSE